MQPVPRPVPMEVDPTRVGKVEAYHPGRPRAGTLGVARNDHVTPPSVYWQDAHAQSCGKERPNVRFGSLADVKRHPSRCLLSGVMRT